MWVTPWAGAKLRVTLAPWHEARGEGRTDRSGAATDVENGRQSARLAVEVFDQIRAAVLADRSQFWKDFSMAFYGYNRPGAKISQGARDSFWSQGMLASIKGVYDCIKAFSETDFTADLKRFDVPTLVIHGDDDQIVPIADSALLSAKIINGAVLKVYKGASHGLCTTIKSQVKEDFLAFINA